MIIKRLVLKNFRNYHESTVELHHGRNILIGENAQGKTNFLEAIELIAHGKSDRVNEDRDLIRHGTSQMRLELEFHGCGFDQTIAVSFQSNSNKQIGGHTGPLDKTFTLNGVRQSQMRSIRKRLIIVTFKSQDLNLLRSGPRFRRDWIDNIAETLKPVYRETLGKYEKVVSQRNRLLKNIFDKGKVTVADQDELKVWDTQLAKFGSRITQERLITLKEILPKADAHHRSISKHQETLSAYYLSKTKEHCAVASLGNLSLREDNYEVNDYARLIPVWLENKSEEELAESILKTLKSRRQEEIARKQTLVGPHRDDIQFVLNDLDATTFASQGQQRSLVLSLKLAEWECISDRIGEAPVLLLDDVLAELDLSRQELLMNQVKSSTQTLITTTHVSGFRPEWLDGALFLEVQAGSVKSTSLDQGKTHEQAVSRVIVPNQGVH